MRRTDVQLTLGLAAASLLQVALVYPIGSVPLGIAVALGTTLPIAFRRTHTVAAVVFASLVWAVPTDGYLLLKDVDRERLVERSGLSRTARSCSPRRCCGGSSSTT